MKKNGELTLVKTNNFVQEYKVKNLTMTEIRIINYLIANIDSPKYDKKFKKFRFDIKEFCEIIYPGKEPGYQYQRLPETIKKLSDKSAWKQVPNPERPGKMKTVLIRWIERPEFDDEGSVTLELNEYLAPYLLEVDKSYFETQFKYTALAQSRYTIPLYELLKSWEKVANHKKRFELMELREYMDATAKSQDHFSEFKRTALEVAVKEINEITDLNISYEPIKRGRKIVAIEFSIYPKARNAAKKQQNKKAAASAESEEQLEGQLNFNSLKYKLPEEEHSAFELCKEMLQEYDFDETTLFSIYKAAKKVVPKELVKDGSPDYLYIKDVIEEKILAYTEYSVKMPIRNPAATFYTCVVEDWHPNVEDNRRRFDEDDLILKNMKNVPFFDK